MIGHIEYGTSLLCHSFLSKLPEEIVYLSDIAFHQLTGKHYIHNAYRPTPGEMLLKRMGDVSIICAVTSLLSGNFFNLSCCVGTLSMCIAGVEQKKSIRELNHVVSDLKETNIQIKDSLGQANKALRKTNAELRETSDALREQTSDLTELNDSLKEEVNELKALITSIQQEHEKLRQLRLETAATKEALSNVELQLQEKVVLLNGLCQHINHECAKLSRDREDLKADLSDRIEELKALLSTVKTLTKKENG